MGRNFQNVETIDQLNLTAGEYNHIFNQLSKMATRLGTTKRLLNTIELFLTDRPSMKVEGVRITDLGCGNGDNLKAIQRYCNRKSIISSLTGIDFNPLLISENIKRHPKINFIDADIISSTFEVPTTDVLLSSHFMYHFQDHELVDFLKKNISKVSSCLIIIELHAGFFWETLFKLIGIFTFKNKVVVSDGIKALQKSWPKGELKKLLESTELFQSIESKSVAFESILICTK